MYQAIANAALVLHLAFILWVIFGALLTKGRTILTVWHISSLLYSIFIEVAYLPCPLTYVEQWGRQRAGQSGYEGGFVAHYLEKVIYPDVPYLILVPSAVAVCVFNLGIYVWRWRKSRL